MFAENYPDECERPCPWRRLERDDYDRAEFRSRKFGDDQELRNLVIRLAGPLLRHQHSSMLQ